MTTSSTSFVHRRLCPTCGRFHAIRLEFDLRLLGVPFTDAGLQAVPPAILDAAKADAYRPSRATPEQRELLHSLRRLAVTKGGR